MIRLAVRALIVIDGRLLIVNAYPDGRSDLWCVPGGGAESHLSLPDNLRREVHEETGLTVEVGLLRLINEFHDPNGPFHQVDLFFWCRVLAGKVRDDWIDPEGVVSARRLVSRAELSRLKHRPSRLIDATWAAGDAPLYDPLEPILC